MAVLRHPSTELRASAQGKGDGFAQLAVDDSELDEEKSYCELVRRSFNEGGPQ